MCAHMPKNTTPMPKPATPLTTAPMKVDKSNSTRNYESMHLILKQRTLPTFIVSAPSLLWVHRAIRVPNPKGRVNEQRSVKGKTSSYGCAKARDAETKPIHGCEPCTGARNQAQGTGVHSCDAAAEALTDEKQAEAQPEAQIRRSNNPKILRANELYFGVAAE